MLYSILSACLALLMLAGAAAVAGLVLFWLLRPRRGEEAFIVLPLKNGGRAAAAVGFYLTAVSLFFRGRGRVVALLPEDGEALRAELLSLFGSSRLLTVARKEELGELVGKKL